MEGRKRGLGKLEGCVWSGKKDALCLNALSKGEKQQYNLLLDFAKSFQVQCG